MSTNQETFEILKMNVDNSCDFVCESCERYFGCTLPEKIDMSHHGRMDIAAKKMAAVKNKICILSGKGGVGKTTCSTNIAVQLQRRGKDVCILDSDFDSPSVPRMMGVLDAPLMAGRNGIIPVETRHGVDVMSVGLLLEDAEVVTWFADMRRSATEEFCANVDYGELDYLIVDLPAGTGVETISVMQYISDMTGAVIVTMASKVAQATARRAATLCKDGNVPILGVVENMSGYHCPSCGDISAVLRSGAGEELAEELNVPFLGRIPLHQSVSLGSDEGSPISASAPDSESAKAFSHVADHLEESIKRLQGLTVGYKAKNA
jgi:ATP-binding protein involved in chromosome partitioning